MLLKVGVLHADFFVFARALWSLFIVGCVRLLNMVLASHVLGMSVMCIFKNPFPAEDPLAPGGTLAAIYISNSERRHLPTPHPAGPDRATSGRLRPSFFC